MDRTLHHLLHIPSPKHFIQAFLYLLANMGLRSSIQKAFGSGPIRALESLPHPLLKEEDQSS